MSKDTREPWKRKRISANERGYGWQWQKIRKQALERDSYLCQDCKAKDILTPAAQVDHIIPKAKGGSNDLDNLRSLCRPCHDQKSARDLGHRVKPTYGPDGWPID